MRRTGRFIAAWATAILPALYPAGSPAVQSERDDKSRPDETPPADQVRRPSAERLPGVPRQDPDMSPYDDQRPDRDLPPQLRRDYAYPDPHLPFGYRNSPPVARYYRFGGRGYGEPYGRYDSRLYSYDYGYGSYWRYLDRFDPYLYELAYRQGITDGRRFERYEREVEMGLASYRAALAAGQESLQRGDYDTAARGFILAARLNQGDPASRVHAANACIGMGRWTEAAALLRRAFELQPNIAFLPIDLRREFTRGDFDDRIAAIRSAIETSPQDADLRGLLGYMQLFSGQFREAVATLSEAARLAPDDPWIATLRAGAGGL